MSYSTTQEQAIKGAKFLRKKLGKQWKTRVWSNLGWHYAAHLADGHVSVHSSDYGRGPTTFHCLISLSHPYCGDSRWSNSISSKDPVKAVKDALRRMKKALKAEQAVADRILKEAK